MNSPLCGDIKSRSLVVMDDIKAFIESSPWTRSSDTAFGLDLIRNRIIKQEYIQISDWTTDVTNFLTLCADRYKYMAQKKEAYEDASLIFMRIVQTDVINSCNVPYKSPMSSPIPIRHMSFPFDTHIEDNSPNWEWGSSISKMEERIPLGTMKMQLLIGPIFPCYPRPLSQILPKVVPVHRIMINKEVSPISLRAANINPLPLRKPAPTLLEMNSSNDMTPPIRDTRSDSSESPSSDKKIVETIITDDLPASTDNSTEESSTPTKQQSPAKSILQDASVSANLLDDLNEVKMSPMPAQKIIPEQPKTQLPAKEIIEVLDSDEYMPEEIDVAIINSDDEMDKIVEDSLNIKDDVDKKPSKAQPKSKIIPPPPSSELPPTKKKNNKKQILPRKAVLQKPKIKRKIVYIDGFDEDFSTSAESDDGDFDLKTEAPYQYYSREKIDTPRKSSAKTQKFVIRALQMVKSSYSSIRSIPITNSDINGFLEASKNLNTPEDMAVIARFLWKYQNCDITDQVLKISVAEITPPTWRILITYAIARHVVEGKAYPTVTKKT